MAKQIEQAKKWAKERKAKKKANPKTKKQPLKGVKNKPKTKKKKEVIENIEVLENVKFLDLKPEMVDKSPNCIYRKLKLHTNKWRKSENEPDTYWGFDYGRDEWLWDHGRTTYKVWGLRFFDKNGVVYETNQVFCKGGWYSKISSPFVRFKDVEKIHYKRKEDFTMNEPFMMSKTFNQYDKQSQAVLYIPMRYLEEMGYTFEDETKVDKRMNYEYRKLLKTRLFDFLVEEKKWQDFEAAKKNLLERLKTCKSKKDVAEAVHELTNLDIPYRSSY